MLLDYVQPTREHGAAFISRNLLLLFLSLFRPPSFCGRRRVTRLEKFPSSLPPPHAGPKTRAKGGKGGRRQRKG